MSAEAVNCATALAYMKSGATDLAAATIKTLIEQNFGIVVSAIEINRDQFSLNSVNGFVTVADQGEFFFKFHHEEDEEETVEELYRGEMLLQAGYPVDVPIYAEKSIGRQILLYRRRNDVRFFDLCKELDQKDRPAIDEAIEAQCRLDQLSEEIYRATLHPTNIDAVAGEAINQLFFHRLTDQASLAANGAAIGLGGRARRFFWDRRFEFPGVTLDAEVLRDATWEINGVRSSATIGALLERSADLLNPAHLAGFGGVTAHGDAHNANVWWVKNDARHELVFFDPAFAGVDVPALIAEIKATFHNILAHPYWLYHPEIAQNTFRAQAHYADGIISVEHDWALSSLREHFLTVKLEMLWLPLLRLLRERKLLTEDWFETLRCALFCCPTLVMDLCAHGTGGHNPTSSLIGLATAVRVGAEPVGATSDPIGRFFSKLADC
jgi:Ser/Thr protein kinase RdoA (MazF antagonist)